MAQFIEQADVGIYAVLVFGFAALGVGVRQLVAPRRARVFAASWLLALTGVSGLLGTIGGVQRAARQFGASSEKWLLLLELQASLDALVAACILIIMTVLVFLYAEVRRTRRQPARQRAAGAR